MKLTTKARLVLEAAAKLQNGIGANHVAKILGIFCGKLTGMRGGQYAGRLIREGWLVSQMEWFRGSRGHDVYSHTSYFITKKGRLALTRERRPRKSNDGSERLKEAK